MDQVATIDVVNQPPTRNTSKRLIDDEVAVVTERGEKGTSTWKETVTVQQVPRAVSAKGASGTGTIPEQTNASIRNQNSSSEEPEAERPSKWTDASGKNADRETVSDVIPIFDKLEAMVTEVQRMVKLVKQDLLNRSVQTSGAQDPTNVVISKTDPSNEELERKVIEDVIEHMKGSFLRAARGTKAVNEVSMNQIILHRVMNVIDDIM
ncbi:unnamed protein product [Haemonchus placei]|uniref:Phosphoprotein n=1 Tax=Haemonchus placei TaxID=6290 RepID=A0A0N4XBE7_HAEPC|nr:unnamed protein product [Haemonchus placei]